MRLERWAALMVFVENGRVEVDNNAAEHALSAVVVGRPSIWRDTSRPRLASPADKGWGIPEASRPSKKKPAAERIIP
jgi:hypothetical protein